MAYQTIPGQGMWIPVPFWGYAGAAPALTSMLIDATGEKAAFCGHVWNKDHATKTINKIHFRFGTIAKGGGSALTVSLQNVSASTQPYQPDESQDQFRAIANADASFATNTWYTTGLITSDGTNGGSKRSVAFGERIAVVIEYDANGRLSTDSVQISLLTGSSTTHNFASTLKTSGTWASSANPPNVILEFDDSTFGTLEGAFPTSAVGSVAYKQDTATDEYCLTMVFPGPVKVDGGWVVYTATAAVTGDFEMVLYDGTSAMTSGTVTIDGAYVGTSGAARFGVFTFADQISLVANTTYRLALRPTQTTANLTLHYFDVTDNGHFQAHAGGSGWTIDSRGSTFGAWTASTNLRRPFIGIRVSAIDDGSASMTNYNIGISDLLTAI